MTTTTPSASGVCLYEGEALARYGFGRGHPFHRGRHDAFVDAIRFAGLDAWARICDPVQAPAEVIERFHDPAYVERVRAASATGVGYLDAGDTPAFPGVYEAAATVVGSVVDAVDRIMAGECRRGFVPIAGLHHARRDAASGFCVFNDCGVAIETLRRQYGIRRVAYVDIDAHHGDGVFYAFEDDPDLIFADIHEDGRYLFPGTGAAGETGRGAAAGSKLNIPLRPGADDNAFAEAWQRVEDFVRAAEPEFVLFQCGADSLRGDPLTHLLYSTGAHRHAAHQLCLLADEFAGGRILAVGGGGYDDSNVAQGWKAVLSSFIEAG